MSALPTFTFGMYTLRPATAEDFPLAAAWNAADPDHRNIDPLFWIDGRDSYLLIDPEGPVFFFKIERGRTREAKFYIQFENCAGKADAAQCRQRAMDGLMDGSAWLEKELSELGFETVYFTSKSRPLIYFCSKRLGFTVEGNVLRKDLRRVSDGEGKGYSEGKKACRGEA